MELTSRAHQQLVQDLWGQGSETLAKVRGTHLQARGQEQRR